MKKLFIAILSAAALMSLSACTTSNEQQPAPVVGMTNSPVATPESAPVMPPGPGGRPGM